jgi:hypothetical protein
MSWRGFPPAVHEAAVLTAARRRGIGLVGAAAYWTRGEGRAGLVLGDAQLAEGLIKRGTAELAAAVSDAGKGGHLAVSVALKKAPASLAKRVRTSAPSGLSPMKA